MNINVPPDLLASLGGSVFYPFAQSQFKPAMLEEDLHFTPLSVVIFASKTLN